MEQKTMLTASISTPLREMIAGAVPEGICLLEFADCDRIDAEIADLCRLLNAVDAPGDSPLLNTLTQQLGEYFAKTRQDFDLPLVAPGTPFQQQVWSELRRIPYGAIRTYGQQAERLGGPKSVRAVAKANGQNRIAIIIPCHRVLGADGSLTGYAGGVWRKQALLKLEGIQLL